LIRFLKVLEREFDPDKKVWWNVVKKSRDWLESVIEKESPKLYGEDLMEALEAFLEEIDLIRDQQMEIRC
jgi:hypothetical protein